MKRVKAYHTQYYKDFQCLGDKCENNCCHDWRIGIDKESYDKYMAMDAPFGDEMRACVMVEKKDPFSARIKLNENGYCPLLSEDGLCRLQLHAGHDALCDICKKYPRRYNKVGNDIEAFLELSCNEVGRITLLNKDLLRFEESELTIGDNTNFASILNVEDYTTASNAEELFWNLRTTSILILQSRQYPLWLRMVILGLFIEEADELVRQEHAGEISELCDDTMDRIDRGFYEPIGEQLEARYDLSLFFAARILGTEKNLDESNRYSRTVLEGLGITHDDATMSELAERFHSTYAKYYSPLLDKNKHILENYCVYLALKTGFPFDYGSEKSILGNYLTLASKYCLIKLILMGASGYYKEQFSIDLIIDYIAYFSRTFDHNKGFRIGIVEFLEDNNANNVGVMGAMMKD